MFARFALLAIALLMPAAPVSAQTVEAAAPDSSATAPAGTTTHANATVVLTTGWTYRNVAVTALDDGRSLEILRADGAALVLAATDVFAIRDAGGVDITALVLPVAAANELGSLGSQFGGSEPQAPPHPPGPDGPRPFDAVLTVDLGYGFPFGEFYDGLDPGLVYGGDLRIATSPRHYVKFCYRNQNVYDETIDVYDPNNDMLVTVDSSLDVRQYLIMFGILSRRKPNAAARGFTEFGIGYGDHVVKAAAGSSSGSLSMGRLMFSVQGGAMFRFSPKSKLGAEIGAFLTAATIGDGDEGGMGMLFGMQAGLTMMFGGDE